MAAVGKKVLRKDGPHKVQGIAQYIDDFTFDNMIYGRTIRSTVPRGKIKSIRYDFPTDEFVIVDHRDIPGKNLHKLIQDDQAMLAAHEVNHMAEPILLLAHPSKEALEKATVAIDYDERVPNFDPRKSKKSFKDINVRRGDMEAAMAKAAHVVEGEYTTGHQEQLYIETNGVIAMPENDGITVYGSLQCPYYVHKALVSLLNLPGEKVRIVQTETGGGFGGKEEYPSMIAGHAALLALKAQRPVKLIYDRYEDMTATTKRHPCIVRHKTGLSKSGKILAMDIEILMDGGAYCTLSPVVLSRGIIHAGGPYRCNDLHIRGKVVQTNTPPNGAFRGFGAPQTQFATEVHMERIAEQLGLDSVEFRYKNALRPGDITATGQKLTKDCYAREVLTMAVERTKFHKTKKKLAKKNRSLGLSLFFHGSGFTGNGEVALASKATLELIPTGARIRVASTEIGQGTRTIHSQIVADTLGIPFNRVEVATPDTAFVPDSGPTVASRTTMVVGKLLERCAKEMKRKLGKLSPKQYLAKKGPLEITKEYVPPPGIVWDEETYQGRRLWHLRGGAAMLSNSNLIR